MSSTVVGTAVGAVLAICALAFGFWAMLLVALFMAVGAAIGRLASGRGPYGNVDLRGVMDALSGKRTSS